MPSKSIKKFTDNLVKGLLPEDKEYSVSCNGLVLRVYPSGVKSWHLNYRGLDGKPGKRFVIGKYPLISLYEANIAAEEARAALERGVDPSVNAKLKSEVIKDSAAFTVQKLADMFLSKHKIGELTKRDYKALLDSYILPHWKDLPVEDINRSHAKVILQELTDRGITRRANMTKTMLQTMWRWGISEDLIESFPFEGLKDPAIKSSKSRFLSEVEIPLFWNGLLHIRSNQTRAALKLSLLLCRRETEVTGAQWDEFDLDKKEWFIPVKRTVLGKDISSGLKVHESMQHKIDGLLVPLPDIAVDILKEIKLKQGAKPEVFVFPSKNKLFYPLTARALTQALYDNWELMGLKAAITPHDLRRTAVTHLSRLGIPEHIVQRVAGHSVGNNVSATYNRYGYLEEKRAALDKWAQEINSLLLRTGKASH